MHTSKYGELAISTHPTNEALGAAAAQHFAQAVRQALAERDEVAVILATGNSQLSFIRAVRKRDDIDWSRITVLHMDEYLAMAENHPASFRRWMQVNLLDHITPRAFHGVCGDHEPVEEELARYTALLRDLDPAICVMGIGENGHLAFNDPPADLDTDDLVHVVALDDTCRKQQVGEGHFTSFDETPTHAISLTVPALLRPSTVLVLAPEARKATAVRAALLGPVTPDCPASILQRAANASLYLDQDSVAELHNS